MTRTYCGVYNKTPQGFFPITLTSATALPNALEFARMTIVDDGSLHADAAGRPFIGCQDASMTHGFAISNCVPAEIKNLHGSVAVHYGTNKSVCSVARLGAAAANLTVECRRAA